MPQIVVMNLKQNLERAVKAKAYAFLEKLAESDALPGLHIEPMNNPADPRARTGRVDQNLRAVLFRLDTKQGGPTYVYAGTYAHDEAIAIAKTQVLRVNPVNGVPELITGSMPTDVSAPASPPAHDAEPPAPWLPTRGYLMSDLTDELGFDPATASLVFEATSEEELLGLAERLPNQWQTDTVLGLACGDSVQAIVESLSLGEAPDTSDVEGGTLLASSPPEETEDERLARSLKHPAAQMQFAFIEDNDELRRVIEGGDFGAWRVFLHPEQRTYAAQRTNGAFRLSGGAGTGKTVVLLHRAKSLARRNPDARIILTTYTRALSAALSHDLERLDPTLTRAESLGAQGVLIRGIDALAVAVRDAAGAIAFALAAESVLGAPADARTELVPNDRGWIEAIDDAPADLPETLRNPAFFVGEYLQVVLPNRVVSAQAYFGVRRPGRGVALDRRKRAAVWAVVERYRANARSRGWLSYAEASSIAAAYLDSHPDARPADHVLVDEAQDLTPSHWQLLRALAAEGPDDLFIAEDSHQRIYGQHVVLSRYGIRIVGRSRRLVLNYRTTQQNLDYALTVLEGGEYTDSEGIEDSAHGYRSARSGPRPRVIRSSTAGEQYDAVATAVRTWLADSEISPGTIAVLARSNREVGQLVEQLVSRGVTVTAASPDTAPRVPIVMTMHRAKGMEFSRVILFDVSAGSVPSDWALAAASDEDKADAQLRERSLLYVAASRARDELVVTWKGERSRLLGATGLAEK